MASRCFALACGDFFQNSSRDFLQISEAREVVLEIVIQELRVLRAQLRPQDHVTQFYGVRKQRFFLQFLERNLGVVVIHGFPQQKTLPDHCTQLRLRVRREVGERNPTRPSPWQA